MLQEKLAKIVEATEQGLYRQALMGFEDIFLTTPIKDTQHCMAEISGLLLHILPKSTIIERRLFINAIATSPNLPNFLIDILLKEDPMASANIIQHAPITEMTLQSMVANASEAKLRSISKRRDLTPRLVTKIMEEGNVNVLTDLARNPKAPLTRQQLGMLSDIAIHDPEMDDALSNRDDLPVEIARKLSKQMSRDKTSRMTDMVSKDITRKRPGLFLRGS